MTIFNITAASENNPPPRIRNNSFLPIFHHASSAIKPTTNAMRQLPKINEIPSIKKVKNHFLKTVYEVLEKDLWGIAHYNERKLRIVLIKLAEIR
jgi:hypothetical protein